jgi:kynurenine formamidase
MKLDVTFRLTKEHIQSDTAKNDPKLFGHFGTHFDVADGEFPIEYTFRRGIVFDASGVSGRDIDTCDVDLSVVEKDSFVGFYTGYIAHNTYGTKEYYANHPQLSYALIDALTERGVSVIGLDFGGIRRGAEHTPADYALAHKGTFVIENLCNLDLLVPYACFDINIYPMSIEGASGLPCRVIAEI